MATQPALTPSEYDGLSQRGTERPTHPLKAWRMSRRIVDLGTKQERRWTVADAARSFSRFVGREVPYQSWMAWERYEDEPAFRRPNDFYTKQIFLFTGCTIRPDHFYPIAEWRRAYAEAAARASAEGAALRGAAPSAFHARGG